MKSAKLLLSALLLLFGITACYDDYTHDYEGADMGFAVAKPLRTVISDRDMNIYVDVYKRQGLFLSCLVLFQRHQTLWRYADSG